MAEQVIEYKGPACTGPLHFDSRTGRLKCDYCSSSYDVKEIAKLYAQEEEQAGRAFDKAGKEDRKASAETAWNMQDLNKDWGEDGAQMRAYTCPSCGAEILCDATTAATSCPYCGNNTIVPGQFDGVLKPDYVIPFRLDKETAISALKNHYRKKFLLPRAFTKENHLEEIKGIYVPFWLFDAVADADCFYHATRSHTRMEGKYRITVTDHYNVRRSGNMQFEHVPSDGSGKMSDDYMDSIEPFDYGELRPFSVAYLPGYLADKYDVSAEKCMARVDRRIRNSASEQMRREVNGYESVAVAGANIRLRNGKVHYALMPVWTLCTKWKDRDYLFIMNGETGRMAGDLPVSRVKAGIFFVVLAAAFFTLFLKTGFGQILAEIIFT